MVPNLGIMKIFKEGDFLLKEGFCDIYLITNTINGKQYVGKATHIIGIVRKERGGTRHRWNEHVREATKMENDPDNKSSGYSRILNAAIIKYGSYNFVYETILVCPDNKSSDFETLMIESYNTFCPNGYNMTEGGEGLKGYKHSEKSREKNRIAATGPNNYWYGKKQPQEMIDKRVAQNSGENHCLFGKTYEEVFGKEKATDMKKKMSDKKKGTNNPNKGGLSGSHKAKIGQSNKIKRRNFTEEQLKEILYLKKSNMGQVEVGEMFTGKNGKKLPRSTISKIWSGKLKPLNMEDIPDYDEYIKYKKPKAPNVKNKTI